MRCRTVVMLALAGLVVSLPALASPGFEAPAKGRLRVAFVMTKDVTMIDFAGPWEVFQDVHVRERGDSMEQMMPFELFTVGVSKAPVRTSGGMAVVPDYTFADAPPADIVVVGAQRGGKETNAYLKKMHARNAVVMSVCTGAFILAEAGLLDGKEATTHHMFFEGFAKYHPEVKLLPSMRFVQSDAHMFMSAGLSSGIDLALHIVSLYFGNEVAEQTARFMEYESTGWRSPKRTAANVTAK